ncbi:MAG TPA: outer membrane lipoprotein carrier protein LolA [Treponema sp.]|nr:outer membrane lipoprotein carrier protein LolA [Treponema sp.]
MKTFRFRIPLLCVLLCAFPLFGAVAQTITTADNFFSGVSDIYSALQDYSATITITTGRGKNLEKMTGRVAFKKPTLLRIDFTNPNEQTIVFDGKELTIYLPTYNVVLTQFVESDSGAGGASLATPQGLALMKRYYSISYETGAEPVPLEEDSDTMVVALLLARRTTTEMFRGIRLLVNPETSLIRRIVATTITGEVLVFDFTGYALNQGVLDNHFVYDSPASSNKFNNFLFTE